MITKTHHECNSWSVHTLQETSPHGLYYLFADVLVTLTELELCEV